MQTIPVETPVKPPSGSSVRYVCVCVCIYIYIYIYIYLKYIAVIIIIIVVIIGEQHLFIISYVLF